jgi:environmental stress-induced protein Ves
MCRPVLNVRRWADATPLPWRNGGGVTRELARHPMYDEFEWRMSVADVSTDGPFSSFEGQDRIIVLLTGAGIDLDNATDRTSVALRPPFGMHRFPGEATVHATLPGGPTTDLNLMWRRDRWDATVQLHAVPVRIDAAGGGQLVAFVVDGAPSLADGTPLAAGDVVHSDQGLYLFGTGRVLVGLLWRR